MTTKKKPNPHRTEKKAVSEKSLANLKPFKPGAEWTGNPGGRPKKKPFTDALAAILAEKPTEARDVVQGLLDVAKKGDSSAFKALADRIEGKVLQGIRMEGELGLSTPEERKAKVVDFLRRAADRIEGAPTGQVQ